MKKRINSKVGIALGLVFTFLLNALGSVPCASAQEDFILPPAGQMMALSKGFNPVVMRGLKVDAANPFRFNFLVDEGDAHLNAGDFKDEAQKVIKYFLTSLTISDDDLWVNLSPYEKNRIIPQTFGRTAMGRDLLAQDYILKQITASLIYPEKNIGKEFWDRVYSLARKKYGTSDVPVNTFNKVWIVPDHATVYVHKGTVFVLNYHLKVMLEQDYLAMEKHTSNDTSVIGSQILREVVIPNLEKEVNEGKNFSTLRQIFYSLILATWYKTKLKQAILNQVYSNRSKVAGVLVDDPKAKEAIYQRYVEAFKKGVFNYIKDDVTPDGQTSLRQYFSGGVLGRIPQGAIGYVEQIPPDAAMSTRLDSIDGSVAVIINNKHAVKGQAEKKKNMAMAQEKPEPHHMIIIGGTFDDKGGSPSSIIVQMYAAMPEGTTLVNGGYFSQIPQLIQDMASYDTVLWFPNIPNDKEKLRDIKERYPSKFVVTSKRNHDNRYTTAQVAYHARGLNSDLVVEFSDTVPFRMRLIDPLGNVFEDTKAPETLARTLVRRLDILSQGTRPQTGQPVNERTLVNGIIVGGVFDDKGGNPSSLVERLHAVFPDSVDMRNGGSIDDLKQIMKQLGKYEVVMWFAQVPRGQDKWLPLIKQRYPFKTLIAPMFNPDSQMSFQEMVNQALGLRSNLFVEFEGQNPIKMKLYDPLANQFTETTDPKDLGLAIIARLEALRKFTRQGTVSIGEALSMPDTDELHRYLAIIRGYGERFHDFIHPAEGVRRFLGNTAFRASYMFHERPKFQDIMYISRRNVDKRDLTKEGFVAVKIGSYVNPRIAYYGEHKPSVDTPTQMRFLNELPNVNFILHTHVYIEGAPFTYELIPCGSCDEVEEVLSLIDQDRSKTNFAINLLGHGSIIFARDQGYLTQEIHYITRPLPEPLNVHGKSVDKDRAMAHALELRSVPDTLGGLFLDVMKNSGDTATLKIFDGNAFYDISWKELHERVIQTAKGLMALGIQHGDRIGILSEDNLEFVYLDLAAVLMGAISVPIFPTNSAEQVRYILDDTKAKAIFVENDKQLSKVEEVKNTLSSLEHVVVMDQMKTVRAKGDAVKDAALQQSVLQVSPSDIATITYTSGTTGRSKGVVLNHANLVAQVKGLLEKIQLESKDIYLSYLPLAHVGGRSSLYAALYNHTVLAIPRGRDIDSMIKDLREIKPTVIIGAPSLIVRIYTHIQNLIARSELNLSNTSAVDSLLADFFGGRLRRIYEGGAALDERIIRFFDKHGVRVLEGYGLTETSSGITFNTMDERKIGSVGRPIKGVAIKIDPTTQEVLVAGNPVMKGYFNKPSETAAALSDGWLHTGDKGEIEDGFLRIKGRIKDLIITSGGSNIARAPIEDALLNTEYFQQVHLIGEGRKYITALVVPHMQRLKDFAKDKGIVYKRDTDLVDNPEIQRLLWGIIERVNHNLDQLEAIRKIAVIVTPFTVESGLLGALGKKSYKNIEDYYRAFIDRLYDPANKDVNVIVADAAMSHEEEMDEMYREDTIAISNFFKRLDVKAGDRIVNVGDHSNVVYGRVAVQMGAHYLGFNKGLFRVLAEMSNEAISRYANRFSLPVLARYIGKEFSSSSEFSAFIPNQSQDFVFMLTGAICDPVPESDPMEVLKEALRVIKDGGVIVVGSHDPFSRNYALGTLRSFISSYGLQNKVSLEIEPMDGQAYSWEFLYYKITVKFLDPQAVKIFERPHVAKKTEKQTTDAAMSGEKGLTRLIKRIGRPRNHNTDERAIGFFQEARSIVWSDGLRAGIRIRFDVDRQEVRITADSLGRFYSVRQNAQATTITAWMGHVIGVLTPGTNNFIEADLNGGGRTVETHLRRGFLEEMKDDLDPFSGVQTAVISGINIIGLYYDDQSVKRRDFIKADPDRGGWTVETLLKRKFLYEINDDVDPTAEGLIVLEHRRGISRPPEMMGSSYDEIWNRLLSHEGLNSGKKLYVICEDSRRGREVAQSSLMNGHSEVRIGEVVGISLSDFRNKFPGRRFLSLSNEQGFISGALKLLSSGQETLDGPIAKDGSKKDPAMNAPGGIDLRSKRYHITIENNGQDVEMNFNAAGIKNLNFDGVEFRINHIQHVLNPQQFLQR